jgi:hypothetical protein
MRKELEQKFVERWPTWFHIDGDISQTLMSFGFEHGDGWFDIVWRLCEELEPLVAEVEVKTGRPFEVLQVKEKLGGLRFWTNLEVDAIANRIQAAELESLYTCEVCGQPGARRTERGMIRTVCGTCAGTMELCEPFVGTFWLYDGMLITDSTLLSEAEPYGDFLTHAKGHNDFWAELQERCAIPIEVEYDEPPRGRVGYDCKKKEFFMLADRCIIEDAGVVWKIIAEFHLQKDTEPLPDSHYRCARCLRRTRRQ